jgi:hypothetical protein
MTVVAISMVKDEVDIVEETVSRMAAQVDRVLIADNGSTDGTREILGRLPGVTVTDDPEVGYFQGFKMSALAARARAEGAEWIVPFDADEVWLPRTNMPLRATLSTLPRHILVAEAALYDYVATGQDPAAGGPIDRMQWRRPDCAPLPKVACRARDGLAIAQGNHSAHYHGVDHPPTVTNLLQIAHFPYRSAEQVVRKIRNGAAAYAATDLPEEQGAHWRGWGQILDEQGEGAIVDLFRKWHWRLDPTLPVRIDGEKQPPLVHDPVV